MKIGLDVGSTTIKAVVLDSTDNIIFKKYTRHYSKITEKTAELLTEINNEVLKGAPAKFSITGSAGMGMATRAGINFVQEVYATRVAAKRLLPETDVIIELGGEDAKILFLSGGEEVRMNGSCAGGTGAFIDQMATLMNLQVDEMNELAKSQQRIYTVASRCGVFAKSDIQPLINQGAQKADIAASIFYAVVNQTVAGLAQGRRIIGNVVYLGGPLTFLSELRKSFDDVLGLTGICPENSLYYVAMGSAFCSSEEVDIEKTIKELENFGSGGKYAGMKALFEDENEYNEFAQRHSRNNVEYADPTTYSGCAYLGVDAGSTTVKLVLLTEDDEILTSEYKPNLGDPLPVIKSFLIDIYKKYPQIKIAGSAVTGYGEELIKNAFGIDRGIVETVAHYTAAKHFLPEVEFIIDIGGQDIKCFKIRNGAIDSIFLNEACSSGCGSFLQTFANALGYEIEDFAKLGLRGDRPVDLGSRCTVFMNSSVKQAQKEGASIENISAGLSISVVKNAIYKVIRTSSPAQLGKHIVVQGGTFYNDAVLRAFEKELGINVVRPAIAGIMGAYGAALYAKEQQIESSTVIGLEELENLNPKITTTNCGLCSNRCTLSVANFGGGRRFISGNRCERPVTKKVTREDMNMYEFKRGLLKEYMTSPQGSRKTKIGIPLGLNMYEMLPFWHAFFTSLGFEVVSSPFSDRQIYLDGQLTIPSDTVCFPAKLLHGHVEWLIKQGVDAVFYPCMSYNFDEGLGDNNYNCPVVAYYPEVIGANMGALSNKIFIGDYLGPHVKKEFTGKVYDVLKKYFGNVTKAEVEKAAAAAYAEYDVFMGKIRARGKEMLELAHKENLDVIVLAGRPYHIDPEINHGIDKLISSFGLVVLSEDGISDMLERERRTVLDQWTYHSRMYAAARYVTEHENMNLIQLVSFGCGVDAITTDETRAIIEAGGKIYTQIKIDEITNLGAVKIRLRSLFAAVESTAKTPAKAK